MENYLWSAEERFTLRLNGRQIFQLNLQNGVYIQNNWKDLHHIVVPWNPSHNIHSSNNRWDSNMVWRGQMLKYPIKDNEGHRAQ